MAKSKAFPEYRLTEPLEVWESLIGKKRRLSNPLKNDDSNRSKQRLEDSFAVDASTSTEDTPEGKELTPNTYTPSQDDAEARHGVLSGNDEDMDKILSNADSDAKLIITRFYTDLRSKKVKVAFDLQPVIDTANEVKVHQSYYFDNPIKKRLFNIKDLTTGKAISAGDLSDLMKSIRWMDTFTALMDGFQYLDKYLTERGDKTSEEKIAQTNLTQNLKILDRVLQASTKSTEATSRVKEQSTDPYVSLRLLHDEAEAAYKEYGEAVKKYEEARELAKNRHSKGAKSNLKAATAAMMATKANYNAKLKRYSLTKNHHPNMDLSEFDDISSKREVRRTISSMVNKLEGRGLRGAGMKPLDGAKRKTNQTYNLNDIQGMATPSAYVYRKIGSKFIRLPDLDKNTLTIVQPNRRKVGPMREISDELQAMVKDLVFRNSISQDKYDHLSINDKRLFKEILEMTHLQYNFDQHLEDPLESLRMEYDKLKGELMLGNNSPSIIKQLKVVCVDMYSNRLISDSDSAFKSIITRLL
ncbi:hypothetical protein V7S43_008128 [Phytophthora oleae]|uniref:Uncharacterized protein n=1 Tax=Phytophthora oleae TaxID=2107226 RepID=A0ABD3FHU4_9STRA